MDLAFFQMYGPTAQHTLSFHGTDSGLNLVWIELVKAPIFSSPNGCAPARSIIVALNLSITRTATAALRPTFSPS